MNKKNILVLLCVIAVLFTRCAKKALPTSITTPIDEVAEINKKYTPEQIAAGKNVFENNCDKCHELRLPNEFNIKMWDRILPKMYRKAELTPDEAGIVRAYIITNAKAGG